MDELIKLELGSLDKLPDGISRPEYDRSELTPGIVHIGVGNFHRWLMAMLQSMHLDQAAMLLRAPKNHSLSEANPFNRATVK